MLRAEAASARASAFAILSAEYARKVAGAQSHLKGAELVAALSAIRQHHLAAEGTLLSKLGHDARIRRRTVLSGLRARRKAQGTKFHTTAAAHGNPSHAAPGSVVKDRLQFRVRRARRQRSPPKPRH